MFLLYPVVTLSTKKENLLNSAHNQDHAIHTSNCEFLCDTQHVRFGVIDFEWQQMMKKQISSLIVSLFDPKIPVVMEVFIG